MKIFYFIFVILFYKTKADFIWLLDGRYRCEPITNSKYPLFTYLEKITIWGPYVNYGSYSVSSKIREFFETRTTTDPKRAWTEVTTSNVCDPDDYLTSYYSLQPKFDLTQAIVEDNGKCFLVEYSECIGDKIYDQNAKFYRKFDYELNNVFDTFDMSEVGNQTCDNRGRFSYTFNSITEEECNSLCITSSICRFTEYTESSSTCIMLDSYYCDAPVSSSTTVLKEKILSEKQDKFRLPEQQSTESVCAGNSVIKPENATYPLWEFWGTCSLDSNTYCRTEPIDSNIDQNVGGHQGTCVDKVLSEGSVCDLTNDKCETKYPCTQNMDGTSTCGGTTYEIALLNKQETIDGTCGYSTEDDVYYICPHDRWCDETTSTCKASLFDVVEQGELCGEVFENNITYHAVCRDNLFCDSRTRKCRAFKHVALGGFCIESEDLIAYCDAGSTCENNRCVEPFTDFLYIRLYVGLALASANVLSWFILTYFAIIRS